MFFTRHIVGFLLFWFGLSTSHANSYLWRFDVRQQGEGIVVAWTTADGFSCEDLKVEHSLDTALTFDVIHLFPGICGTDSSSENYFFAHRNPVYQKVNFYRIDLGQFGKSDWIEILPRRTSSGQIDLSEHPLSANGTIYFESTGANSEISLISISGQLSKATRLEQGRKSFPVAEFGPIPAGMYVIQLMNNQKVQRRRVLIL
jgi:hypothetical protein